MPEIDDECAVELRERLITIKQLPAPERTKFDNCSVPKVQK
jgi:hypothetical protein